MIMHHFLTMSPGYGRISNTGFPKLTDRKQVDLYNIPMRIVSAGLKLIWKKVYYKGGVGGACLCLQIKGLILTREEGLNGLRTY